MSLKEPIRANNALQKPIIYYIIEGKEIIIPYDILKDNGLTDKNAFSIDKCSGKSYLEDCKVEKSQIKNMLIQLIRRKYNDIKIKYQPGEEVGKIDDNIAKKYRNLETSINAKLFLANNNSKVGKYDEAISFLKLGLFKTVEFYDTLEKYLEQGR